MEKYLNLRHIICQGLIFAFLVNTFGPMPSAQAQEFVLPQPGQMVPLSPVFNPPILKGLKVHPDNPFRFDFILDQGDSPSLVKEGVRGSLKQESTKLIKYFLASLTIPEKDLWVNLSPYEKNRIVPEAFGQTVMGRDLLAEDYILKQITASLIYPEGKTGKEFWNRVYEEAFRRFGTTNIPINTFNKVWIVPEKAVVYENAQAGTAYVVESKLKVMLEQDYLSMQKHGVIVSEVKQSFSAIGNQIIRAIIIPQLTREVNYGRNFTQLRQVYNSLILATWYKKKIKESILAQVYEGKNKIEGVNINDSKEKQRIYEQYLQAFKKGAYNYIKEEIDPTTQQRIPRKYFSGGMNIDPAMVMEKTENSPIGNLGLMNITANISALNDAAMIDEKDEKVSREEVLNFLEQMHKDKLLRSFEMLKDPKQLKKKEFVPFLKDIALDLKVALDTREKAVEVLRWMHLPEANFALKYLATTPVPAVNTQTRIMAIPSYYDWGHRGDGILALQSIAMDENESLADRIQAIEQIKGLGFSEQKAAIKAYTAIANDFKVSIRVRALAAAEAIETNRWDKNRKTEKYFLNILKSFIEPNRPFSERMAGMEGLGLVGAMLPEAIFLLVDVFNQDRDPKIKNYAILQLVSLWSKDVRSSFISNPELAKKYPAIQELFKKRLYFPNPVLLLVGINEEEVKNLVKSMEDYWESQSNDLFFLMGRLKDLDINNENFPSEELIFTAKLAREIIHAGVIRYINIISSLKESVPFNDSRNQILRDFVTSNSFDLRQKADFTNYYVQIYGLEDLVNNDQQSSEAKDELTAAIKESREHLENTMKSASVDGLTISQRRRILGLARRAMDLLNQDFLKYILGRNLRESEVKLLEDDQINQKIVKILSLVSTLRQTRRFKESDLVRLMLSYFLNLFFSSYDPEKPDAIANAKIVLSDYIMNFDAVGLTRVSPRDQKIKKSNKEVIEDLVKEGYSKELWTKGIEFESSTDGFTEEQRRHSILQASYELVEIVLEAGMKTFKGATLSLDDAAKFASYRMAKLLVDEVIEYRSWISRTRLYSILDNIKAMERQRIVPNQPRAKFKIVIKKDFLEEALAGLGVPGCYDPKGGEFRQMPLIHAMEANAGFIQIFNDLGIQVANAAVAYGNQGAYVFPNYNGSTYNMDPLFGEAVVQLAKYVPQVFIGEHSAGYKSLLPFGKRIQQKIEIIKPPTIFRNQNFDVRQPGYPGPFDDGEVRNGELTVKLENPLVITKEFFERQSSVSDSAMGGKDKAMQSNQNIKRQAEEFLEQVRSTIPIVKMTMGLVGHSPSADTDFIFMHVRLGLESFLKAMRRMLDDPEIQKITIETINLWNELEGLKPKAPNKPMSAEEVKQKVNIVSENELNVTKEGSVAISEGILLEHKQAAEIVENYWTEISKDLSNSQAPRTQGLTAIYERMGLDKQGMDFSTFVARYYVAVIAGDAAMNVSISIKMAVQVVKNIKNSIKNALRQKKYSDRIAGTHNPSLDKWLKSFEGIVEASEKAAEFRQTLLKKKPFLRIKGQEFPLAFSFRGGETSNMIIAVAPVDNPPIFAPLEHNPATSIAGKGVVGLIIVQILWSKNGESVLVIKDNQPSHGLLWMMRNQRQNRRDLMKWVQVVHQQIIQAAQETSIHEIYAITDDIVLDFNKHDFIHSYYDSDLSSLKPEKSPRDLLEALIDDGFSIKKEMLDKGDDEILHFLTDLIRSSGFREELLQKANQKGWDRISQLLSYLPVDSNDPESREHLKKYLESDIILELLAERYKEIIKRHKRVGLDSINFNYALPYKNKGWQKEPMSEHIPSFLFEDGFDEVWIDPGTPLWHWRGQLNVSDVAMTVSDINDQSSMERSRQGGVDLTSHKALLIQNNGQAMKFHIDPAQLAQLQNASGFVPVIVNIQPVTNIRQWLGLNDQVSADQKMIRI